MKHDQPPTPKPALNWTLGDYCILLISSLVASIGLFAILAATAAFWLWLTRAAH